MRKQQSLLMSVWLAAILFLVGCSTPLAGPAVAPAAVPTLVAQVEVPAVTTMPIETTPAEAVVTIPADAPTATPLAVVPTATLVPPTPSPSPFPTTAVTPGPAGQCGVLLPVIAGNTEPQTTAFANPDALDAVPAIPAEVRPALEWLLAEPGRVGLVAYRVGDEAEGIYLNPDTAMPLASVVKIIHLVAYAQAVQAGELDPQMVVPLIGRAHV